LIHGASFAPVALKATPLSDLHPAVRLAAAVLALLTCLAASPLGLAVMAAGLVAALKPWAPVALLVIVVHTFTSTWAAPLWHPSVAGALAGGKALLRVVCSVGCLGLYLRVTPLDDLVVGVSWWLRPLRFLGIRTEDLGLVVAVALGTAPVMLGEGRRIEAVVTMRQAAPAGVGDPRGRSPIVRFFQGVVTRARVVVPLVEILARRSEALTLSLKHRRPDPVAAGRVPVGQLLFVGVWAAGLVWLAVVGGPEVSG
jgi:energy-coupling factor transporter transmembrane protein EcfT